MLRRKGSSPLVEDHEEDKEAVEEGVKVYVRVRPALEKEVLQDGGLAVSTVNAEEETLVIEGKDHTIRCQYDGVFDETTTQAEVFKAIKPALSEIVAGINGCIFAYGQTGSGKTHTMIGPDGGRIAHKGGSSQGSWGIIPRAVTYLMERLRELTATGTSTFSLHCSYMQIYNEKLHDLLQEQGFRDNLEIHEMLKGRNQGEIYVSGLAEYRVKDVDDVLELIQQGNRNRAIRATECNEVSSRSHAVLQLLVDVESTGLNGQRTMKRAKLSMVDLAGSEKIKKQHDITQRHLKELTSINRSLSSLGNVIAALTEKKRTHIPYRDSKLTRLMQDCLGGNCRTVVIACISPGKSHAEESISTSQFADRARNVLVRLKANEVVDDKVLLSRAQAEIARLKLILRERVENDGKGNNQSSAAGAATQAWLEEKDRQIKQLNAENAALRGEVKRLKIDLECHNRRQRMGKVQKKTTPSNAASGKLQNDDNNSNSNSSLRSKYANVPSAAAAAGTAKESLYYDDILMESNDRQNDVADHMFERQQQHRRQQPRYSTSQQLNNTKPPRHSSGGKMTSVRRHSTTSFPSASALLIPPLSMKKKGRNRSAVLNLSSTLRSEEAHLINIREQRRKLEQQLATLQQRAPPSAADDEEQDERQASAGHSRRRQHSDSNASSTSFASSRPSTADERRKKTSMIRSKSARKASNKLELAYLGGSAASMSPAFSFRSDTEGGREEAGRILNNISDIGLMIKVYSYRYDDWSTCTIIGYDRIRKMHYCRYEESGEKQWHSLGTKKVEILPRAVVQASYESNNSSRPGSSRGGGESEGEGEEDYDDNDWEELEQSHALHH